MAQKLQCWRTRTKRFMIDQSCDPSTEKFMIARTPNHLVAASASLLLMTSLACAQVQKDVPFVPTPQPVVDEMLRLAAPKEGEMLYDLGCGDGRIVVTAAKKYKVKGIGVDIDPQRIKESNENAKKEGVTDRVKFLEKNLFEMDFSDADILCMYLLTSVNAKLKPKILEDMKPGARVVSHAFDMGDWKPDKTVQVASSNNRTVYFWLIPARVDGTVEVTLKTPQGDQKATLNIKRKYQEVTGTARIGDKQLQITDGKLAGDQLTFTADGQKYTGKVPVKDGKAPAERRAA
jgi:SAM-dependent methyltransferase